MQRIGIRDLRNDTSRVVKRARGGERIIVTIDGVPAAELGPIRRGDKPTLEDLIAAGRVRPPLVTSPPRPANPIDMGPGPTTTEIILRDRYEE